MSLPKIFTQRDDNSVAMGRLNDLQNAGSVWPICQECDVNKYNFQDGGTTDLNIGRVPTSEHSFVNVDTDRKKLSNFVNKRYASFQGNMFDRLKRN